MNLLGLVTVKPEQAELIDALAIMMGESFMEEYWTREWLSALDPIGCTPARKLEVSRAIMRYDFRVGASFQCVYALPDLGAVAGGCLSSELKGRRWSELENEATALMMQEALSDEESDALAEKAAAMAAVSDFDWLYAHTEGREFVHFYALGVNSAKRGSGAFRRLMTPFLDFADEQGLDCYLECFSDRTEALYSHFGFQTIEHRRDSALSLVERCMRRRPKL